MSIPTLYKLCVVRTGTLLKADAWKTEKNAKPLNGNPFSQLATKHIDDLMEFIISNPFPSDQPRLSQVFPLLTSGKLTRLELHHFDLVKHSADLSAVLCSDLQLSFRVLVWLSYAKVPLVKDLILFCPDLEEVYMTQRPSWNAFRNCKKLRIVKFFDGDSVWNCSALSSLPNLTEIHLPHADWEHITHLLEHCPNLVSLGLYNSTVPLKRLCDKYQRPYSGLSYSDLKLRRCLWGKDVCYELVVGNVEVDFFFLNEVRIVRLEPEPDDYINMIRVAVSLCPNVEELIFFVFHKDSMEPLKQLKHLSLLSISFRYCRDCLPQFISLLQAIGPQLRHLCMVHVHSFPLDVITDHCPNLENLMILGHATVSQPAQTNPNVTLKTARIETVDRDGLFFLISCCRGLRELHLGRTECFDDVFVREIAKQNVLAKLQVVSISCTGLSRRGFLKFLMKATSLETVCFPSPKDFFLLQSLVKDLSLNVEWASNYQLEKENFFKSKLSGCRF